MSPRVRIWSLSIGVALSDERWTRPKQAMWWSLPVRGTRIIRLSARRALILMNAEEVRHYLSLRRSSGQALEGCA